MGLGVLPSLSHTDPILQDPIVNIAPAQANLQPLLVVRGYKRTWPDQLVRVLLAMFFGSGNPLPYRSEWGKQLVVDVECCVRQQLAGKFQTHSSGEQSSFRARCTSHCQCAAPACWSA